MRESPAAGPPGTAPRTGLKALAAFAVGMLIALAAALAYIHVQRKGALQAQNVVRPESPPVQTAELKPTAPPPGPAEHAPAPDDSVPAYGGLKDPDGGLQDGSAGVTDDNSALKDENSGIKDDAPAGDTRGENAAPAEAQAPAPQGSPPPASTPPVAKDAARKLPASPPRPSQSVAVSRPRADETGADTSTPLAAPPKRRLITVPPGTLIPVRLAETLSSDRNRTGDTFRASLTSSLIVNGAVLAHAGSTVLGSVVHARKAPLIGGAAELSLDITDITASDGRLLKVESDVYQQKGAHSSIVNTAKMTTGAAIGAVVGALTGAAEGAGISSGLKRHDRTNGFMATKRVVVLPAGTEATFALAAPAALPEQADAR